MNLLWYLLIGAIYVLVCIIDESAMLHSEWKDGNFKERMNIVLTWIVIYAIWPLPFISEMVTNLILITKKE